MSGVSRGWFRDQGRGIWIGPPDSGGDREVVRIIVMKRGTLRIGVACLYSPVDEGETLRGVLDDLDWAEAELPAGDDLDGLFLGVGWARDALAPAEAEG